MNNQYTSEILNRITERARVGHSLQDISLELNIDFQQFIEDYQSVDSEVYAAYNKGITTGLQSVRDKTFVLARGGSLQAAKDYENAMKVQSRKDFLRQQREL